MEKQPKDDFKDRNKLPKNSETPKPEISETGLDRMNGPVDGVEITEQDWEAIKAETARRKSMQSQRKIT